MKKIINKLRDNDFVIILYSIISACGIYNLVSFEYQAGIVAFFELVSYILLVMVIIIRKKMSKNMAISEKMICLLPTIILIFSIFIDKPGAYATNFLFKIANILKAFLLPLLVYLMSDANEYLFNNENKFLNCDFLCKLLLIGEFATSFFFVANINTFTLYIFDFVIWIMVFNVNYNLKSKSNIDRWIIGILIIGVLKIIFRTIETIGFAQTLVIPLSISYFAIALEAVFIVNCFQKHINNKTD